MASTKMKSLKDKIEEKKNLETALDKVEEKIEEIEGEKEEKIINQES